MHQFATKSCWSGEQDSDVQSKRVTTFLGRPGNVREKFQAKLTSKPTLPQACQLWALNKAPLKKIYKQHPAYIFQGVTSIACPLHVPAKSQTPSAKQKSRLCRSTLGAEHLLWPRLAGSSAHTSGPSFVFSPPLLFFHLTLGTHFLLAEACQPPAPNSCARCVCRCL